jgi:hypothetical protein
VLLERRGKTKLMYEKGKKEQENAIAQKLMTKNIGQN